MPSEIPQSGMKEEKTEIKNLISNKEKVPDIHDQL